MAVSSNQITTGRAPVSDPRLRRTCHSSKPAAAITPNAKIHTGQAASNTNCPFWKTAPGYLKKNSNMGLAGRSDQDTDVARKNVLLSGDLVTMLRA